MDTTATTEPSQPTEPEALPPHTIEALEPILQPLVGDDYRVTRAALIDTATYQAAPDGTHLAVYLEPLNDMTPDEFAGAIAPTAHFFLPFVFDTWSALESFDVCLEPFGWEQNSTPPSQTIVNVTREAAAGVDWETVDLSGLLARNGPGFTIWGTNFVRESATWRDAES